MGCCETGEMGKVCVWCVLSLNIDIVGKCNNVHFCFFNKGPKYNING